MSRGKSIHPELRKLTARETKFAQIYFDTSNAITAYKEAGYNCEVNGKPVKYLGQRAYQVKRKAHIKRAIAELEARRADKDEYTIDWLRAEHIRLMQAAEAKGDYACATRNLELIGQSVAAYKDTMQVDIQAVAAYTEVQRIEAHRLARLMLEGEHDQPVALPAPDTVDAEVVGSQPANSPQSERKLDGDGVSPTDSSTTDSSTSEARDHDDDSATQAQAQAEQEDTIDPTQAQEDTPLPPTPPGPS